MSHLYSWLREHARQLAALSLIVGLYGATRLPRPSEAERARLVERFHFRGYPLPELGGGPHRDVRSVHPSLRHIRGWISAVGAGVALADLDRDGKPNDLCYVDPRSDRVIVARAPGSPAAYPPFQISPEPLRFDPARMAPMGCLPADLDEDGRVDLLVYYWGRTPVAFLSRGQGAALSREGFVPRELVAGRERWYTNAATSADVDGDGHLDLLIGNYFPDGARILDPGSDGQEQMQHSMSRASNGGLNRVLLWARTSPGESPAGVRFVEAANAMPDSVRSGWTLALGAADLDGDLLPEVYVANDFGPDRLLHNRSVPGHVRLVPVVGRSQLGMPRSKVLGRDSFKGMGVDFGDLNGDGYPDIYVSNIAAEYALEESHFVFLSSGQPELFREGIAPYVDHGEELGLSRSSWGWEARLGDFDNDGVLEALQATGFLQGKVDRWPELQELAIGNDELLQHPPSWPRLSPGDDVSGHEHVRFFVRSADGRYYDVARELGLGELQPSRGIATADVDHDGDLDFAVANQWAESRLFLNRAPHPGAFLGLRLLLPLDGDTRHSARVYSGDTEREVVGRPAVGAEAVVHLPDGRRVRGQVDGGNGHSGKRSPELHFGLGSVPASQPLRVDLRWRTTGGQVQKETIQLTPGWYSVVLGNQVTEVPSE